MAPGCVNILMHYGGTFADQEPLTYEGGEVQLFRNIDKDVMSYFHVLELAKSVGFNDGDNLFYGVPGRSLEASIDLLKDDTSVREMLKFADQTNFLEIYIQHKEHGRRGKQTVGNTVQDTDNTKIMAPPAAMRDIILLIEQFRHHRMRIVIILHVALLYWVLFIRKQRLRLIREPCRYDSSSRTKNLNDMIYESDIYCVQQLRMDRRCFWNLCSLVRDIGGLRDTRNVKVEEMVAMFLHVLAYNEKSRSMRTDYQRSQETISRHFNNVLGAVLKLWRVLLKSPQPITDDCKEERWRWFKNCLGALDGTYIKVRVPAVDKPRYRSRKNDIATNVLGACTPDMQFTYVLAGWEGSAADARVLRDALSRPNGLRIPRGCYYLVDAGYKNCDGFLAPFRGQRYHLKEWTNPPTRKEELFNMKHSSARNVIERTFGLLKLRWGIIRNGSYYPIETQIGIILACCYLHNLIRQQMGSDPLEAELDDFLEHEISNLGVIDRTESSREWTDFRDGLATSMWNAWKSKTQN